MHDESEAHVSDSAILLSIGPTGVAELILNRPCRGAGQALRDAQALAERLAQSPSEAVSNPRST